MSNVSHDAAIDLGMRAARALCSVNSETRDYFVSHIVEFARVLSRDQEGVSFASYDDASAVADLVESLTACAHFVINPE